MNKLSPLNWIQWLTVVLSLTTAITGPILFNRLTALNQHQNDSLRAVICRIETVVITDKQLTPQQLRQQLNFYNSLLATIHVAPCQAPPSKAP